MTCAVFCKSKSHCSVPSLFDQISTSRRFLQDSSFKVGTWNFEHENKLKFKVDQYDIGVTLIGENLLNIRVDHPDSEPRDIEY